MPRKALDDSMIDVSELVGLWDTADDMIFRLGTVPAKVATSAAGAGATPVKNRIKALAPRRSGALRKGIVRKGEKSRTKGKKVYDLTFDSGMNGTFQKPIMHPGRRGSTKTGKGYAYYPVSQDSGFITKQGNSLRYIEGKHFMREGAETSQLVAEKAMLEKLNQKLEVEWMKRTEGPNAK